MRYKRVFILRLLVDEGFPDQLQGVLCPASDPLYHRPFHNGQELLDLLTQLTATAANSQACVITETRPGNTDEAG
jgi:hypothetical protein